MSVVQQHAGYAIGVCNKMELFGKTHKRPHDTKVSVLMLFNRYESLQGSTDGKTIDVQVKLHRSFIFTSSHQNCATHHPNINQPRHQHLGHGIRIRASSACIHPLKNLKGATALPKLPFASLASRSYFKRAHESVQPIQAASKSESGSRGEAGCEVRYHEGPRNGRTSSLSSKAEQWRGTGLSSLHYVLSSD